MSKRPRLAANMRMAQRASRPAETEPAVIGVDPASQIALVAVAPPAVVDPQVRGSVTGRPDGLVDIVGDSVAATALASVLAWNQGVALQLRLASYMLGATRRLPD